MEAVGMLGVVLFLMCKSYCPIIAVVIGGVGLLASRKKPGLRNTSLAILIIGIIFTIWVGLDSLPDSFWISLRPGYYFGDEKLEPYESAILEIDRESIGFSVINQDTEMRILPGNEEKYVSCPDIEIYISDPPIREHHICLTKINDKYVWYSEYEIFYGPNSLSKESIWIAYSSQPDVLQKGRYYKDDIDPYTIEIQYWGSSDSRIENTTLTLENIQPFLDEWKNYHENNSE